MELFSECFKREHALARADARVKILASLAVLVMVLSHRGVIFPLFVAALCISACIRLRIPLRILLLRFSEPLFIVSVVILLKLFFGGKEALFSVSLPWLKISCYRDGLMEGLIIASRIAGAVSVVALLGFSTPFAEFMAGLSWLRIPKGLIEISLFAYRYIFVLLEDAMVIYNAQKNRLGYSGVRRGLSSFGVLSGSLILKAFEHSQNTTVAMVQRGYDGNMPMMRHRPFVPSEIILLALCIIMLGLIWRI